MKKKIGVKPYLLFFTVSELILGFNPLYIFYVMATTGHENESINVGGLKASLQSLKSTYIDNTVWTNAQTLSVTQKDQAASNILDKTDTSGMKRVVLKKSDNFKTKVEGQTGGNTIFVIQYDCTLSGNVSVPANCILEFEGGSLSGAYTITGNNTSIQASLVKIFNTNVTLAGTWNVAEAYPEWFGAKGDNTTDDTTPIQKTVNYFNNVIFSKHYIITNTIELTNTGIHIEGIGSNSMFGNTTSIKNTTANKGVFHITTQTDYNQVIFPFIKGIYFIADYPIVFNNPETAVISDGSDSNIPYGMKPIILDCGFFPLTSGVGTAITFVKCFDGRIQNCEINDGFNIGILFLGCDISVISNNRIWGCTYCICDFGVGTFGSQTKISENDLLMCSNTFIKTTNSQVRIFNNYMEKISGSCTGIDITNIGFGTIGNSNTNTTPTSIYNYGNRFECSAGTFYRIIDKCKFVVINENLYPAFTYDLKVVDSNGNDSMFEVFTPNYQHIFDIKINGLHICNRNFFDNRNVKYLAITNNTLIPQNLLIGNNFYTQVRYSNIGDLVMLNGGTIAYISENILNVNLKRSTKYIFRICAKSYTNDTPSTIQLIKIRNNGGYDPVVNLVTSNDYKNLDTSITTDATFNNQGFAILSISNKVIVKSIDIFVADSGSTSERPSYDDLEIGFKYFDTTLNKPIWHKGSNVWVDATGATV